MFCCFNLVQIFSQLLNFSRVEDELNSVLRGATLSCFRYDFGTPENIVGQLAGRKPPCTDTHSQEKWNAHKYRSFLYFNVSGAFGIACSHSVYLFVICREFNYSRIWFSGVVSSASIRNASFRHIKVWFFQIDENRYQLNFNLKSKTLLKCT